MWRSSTDKIVSNQKSGPLLGLFTIIYTNKLIDINDFSAAYFNHTELIWTFTFAVISGNSRRITAHNRNIYEYKTWTIASAVSHTFCLFTTRFYNFLTTFGYIADNLVQLGNKTLVCFDHPQFNGDGNCCSLTVECPFTYPAWKTVPLACSFRAACVGLNSVCILHLSIKLFWCIHFRLIHCVCGNTEARKSLMASSPTFYAIANRCRNSFSSCKIMEKMPLNGNHVIDIYMFIMSRHPSKLYPPLLVDIQIDI